jgi:hypothetical protein
MQQRAGKIKRIRCVTMEGSVMLAKVELIVAPVMIAGETKPRVAHPSAFFLDANGLMDDITPVRPR